MGADSSCGDSSANASNDWFESLNPPTNYTVHTNTHHNANLTIPATHFNQTPRPKKIRKAYTEGLRNVRLGDGSPELNAVAAALLANRAAANLALKNYGSCRKDCDEALLLDPGNVKCLYRKAKAELLLRRHGCVSAAQRGRGGGGGGSRVESSRVEGGLIDVINLHNRVSFCFVFLFVRRITSCDAICLCHLQA